jgi:hypothetical protein
MRSDHLPSVARGERPVENGDDSSALRTELQTRHGAACDRLIVFQWEWVSESDIDPETGRRVGREWVEAKGHHVSDPDRVNLSGLQEAAEEIAGWLQRELHARRPGPLTLGETSVLWGWRVMYLNALYYRGGHRLAKTVEARVSPNQEPLSICVGSNRRAPVTVFLHGRPQEFPLHGWQGCLKPFPETPYGRGRQWARWCPECRGAKSNAKQAAIRRLRRRAVDMSGAP